MKNLIEYLDLPPLPTHLCELADPLSYPRSNTRLAYCERNGDMVQDADYRIFPIGADLTQWVMDNISTVYTDARMSFHGGSHSGPTTVGPHSDRKRNIRLLYMIDTGGPEVDTVFWQEVNQALHREPATVPCSYRDLTEVSRYRLTAGTWALIDTTVIHSVENIQGLRKTLQIDWADPALAPYDKILVPAERIELSQSR